MKPVPIEDQFTDILGKAQRGLQIADSALAEKCGVSVEEWKSLRDGKLDETTLRKAAPLLGLDTDALLALAQNAWHPEKITVSGLKMVNTPFDDMTVNSYVVWDAKSGKAAAFDTGSDCTEMLDCLKENNLSLTAIFLTHTHGDHIFDLDRLKEKTGAPVFVSRLEDLDEAEAEAFDAGKTFEIGALKIATRQTTGHSVGGITYVISGLERSVAIAGDALFAGSMGGGMISYQDALRTNREQLFTLPDETIICPGHGPCSTIGEERLHNPFFAKQSR